MRKLNKWTAVKCLVFAGGIYTLYKLATMNGENVEIDGEQWTVYGKNVSKFVKDIMETTEL